MRQTNRIVLNVLTRITTKREALIVWLIVGAVILTFLYYNQRIDQ